MLIAISVQTDITGNLTDAGIISDVARMILNVFITRLLTPEIIGKCTAFLSIIFVSVLSLLI